METMRINRSARERDEPPQMMPEPVEGQSDLVTVDTTWGELQPMEVAPGVRTIGELELIDLATGGVPLVDGRTEDFFEVATLPGAVNMPYGAVADHCEELDVHDRVIFFCNGPQCPQSPTAIDILLEEKFPAEKILYYRGGMHDWMTLGLPTEPGEPRTVLDQLC